MLLTIWIVFSWLVLPIMWMRLRNIVSVPLVPVPLEFVVSMVMLGTMVMIGLPLRCLWKVVRVVVMLVLGLLMSSGNEFEQMTRLGTSGLVVMTVSLVARVWVSGEVLAVRMMGPLFMVSSECRCGVMVTSAVDVVVVVLGMVFRVGDAFRVEDVFRVVDGFRVR